MSIGSRSTFLPSGILIHSAIWLQQLWAENWGLCPFGRRGARSSSNTMWPWPRHTCVPSFILIHPTIWPRYTNVTYRQDRQWSDRIGRTVLQTVAQTYHLLIVFDLRYSLILLFMFKFTQDCLRAVFENYYSAFFRVTLLHVHVTNHRKRTIQHIGTRLWNSLTPDLQACCYTYSFFKNKVALSL